jgi:hypothetical protein
MTLTASTSVLGVSLLKIRFGAALQRHRLSRNLTQRELADLSSLSLKYVGEIERGEANTTLDVNRATRCGCRLESDGHPRWHERAALRGCAHAITR